MMCRRRAGRPRVLQVCCGAAAFSGNGCWLRAAVACQCVLPAAGVAGTHTDDVICGAFHCFSLSRDEPVQAGSHVKHHIEHSLLALPHRCCGRTVHPVLLYFIAIVYGRWCLPDRAPPRVASPSTRTTTAACEVCTRGVHRPGQSQFLMHSCGSFVAGLGDAVGTRLWLRQ